MTGHARLAGWPGEPLPLPLGPNGHEYAITEAGASDDLISIPEDRNGAAELLRHGIRSGLTPFHPELRIALSDDNPRWETTYGGGLGYYYICCLGLYNHIVAEAALISCGNKRCARLFVHQEGRAKHGQHRSVGVKYCSPECARAQAQREYRRRKATG